MKMGAVKATVHVMVPIQFSHNFLHSSDLDKFRNTDVHKIFERLRSSRIYAELKVIQAYMNVYPLLATFSGK
jgi:hypothetical protein